MESRALINASNLHYGGGVQVATSFISECVKNKEMFAGSDIDFIVSTTVFDNLLSIGITEKNLQDLNLRVFDSFGIFALNPGFTRLLNEYDVVFTVFGPLYIINRKFRSIVGFAQPWIIYPENDCSRSMALSEQFINRLKYGIQKLFFKLNSDVLVVELEHVADELRKKGFSGKAVHVIPNCVSGIYLKGQIAVRNHDVVKRKSISIGFLGRAYAHKNIQVLAKVCRTLEDKYSLRARAHVSLNSLEWALQTDEFKFYCVNHGTVCAGRGPEFYAQIDAVVVPSLLECFSATPLEAMSVGLPAFVSNYRFFRESCQDHALYIDPLDPIQISDTIFSFFCKPTNEIERHVDEARDFVATRPNAKYRAERYIQLIRQETSLLHGRVVSRHH